MSGSIYLLGGDGRLEAMNEQPYDSESLLQELLASYPDLLAGEQMNPDSPRRWLLIRREAGIPDAEGVGDRWAVDHLFLDQDGIPTLVEVKRGADTRIRREVVGQMLDYAANAVVHWPADRIRVTYEAECEARGVDADALLHQFLGADGDPVSFWTAVKTNLQAGRIRMVFVSDMMPPELTRIVEFLNEQMDPAEVLAVEVRQYVGAARKTLVPRVVGQTAQAQEKKAARSPGRQWDEASFLQELRARQGPELEGVAKQVIQWARSQRLRLWYGKGAQDGSLFPMLDVRGVQHWTFSLWTYGTVEVTFQMIKEREPFAPEHRRRELAERLNAIPGIAIPLDGITRRPTVSMRTLTADGVLARFLAVFDWYVAEIRSHGAATTR